MNELESKINALGADTIMGQLNTISTDETNEQLANTKEAIEAANVAVGAPTGAMPIQYYRRPRPIVRDYKKIGRNEQCPCGSGKKYKNCCLDSGKYETTHTA